MSKFNQSLIGAAAALALGTAAPAFAVATDYSTLTGAVDFSTVGTALLAIGALMMVPKVAKWGINKVLSMIRG